MRSLSLTVSAPQSLVLASLDIGRVLADRDGVTFRAQGTCMYPTVRPRDVLRIESRAIADVGVGDLVVCRGPGYLFSHRVIDTGVREGRAYLLTRPDRACTGSDAPTFDEDFLGVVVAIERHGQPVPLLPAAYPWPARRYFAARLALIEAGPRLRLWLINALERVQSRAVYQHLARGWLALAQPRLSYTVRLPLNATVGEAVYRQLSPEAFDPQAAWLGQPVQRWTLTLHLNGRREPAAWATCARRPDGAWGVAETGARVRYRGMGLEAALRREAEAIWGRAAPLRPD